MLRLRAASVLGLFERLFDIKPREFVRVQMFLALLTVYSIFYTMAATTGDTLFLSRFGAERASRLLPWVYVGTGIATVAATWLYERLEERVPRRQFVIAVNSLLAASVFLFRAAIHSEALWLYFALVIWLEACALVALMLFFSFAGDYFTTRDARRLYGYINGGIAAGSILGGCAVEPLVQRMGDNNLLYVCAALMAAGALLCLAISVSAKPLDAGAADEEDEAAAPLSAVLGERYLQIVILLVLASQACGWLVDYQLKVVASARMQEEALATFFGRFYGALGATQLVVQLALVGWLLRRYGVIRSLFILPALLLLSCGAFFLHPVFIVAVAGNFARLAFLETLDEPGQELLFLPLPSRLRVRAQSFVEGMVLPLGISLAGLLLLGLKGLDLRHVSLVSTALGAAWLACVAALLPRYRATLAASLSRFGLGAAELPELLAGADSSAAMRSLLEEGEVEPQLLGLDLCSGRPLGPLAPAVRTLASSSAAAVAVKALEVLALDPAPDHREEFVRACTDPRPEVRAAAIRARLELDAAAAGELPRWLADESAAVQAVTLTYGLDRGDRTARRAVLERLRALAASSRPGERALAARVLARAPAHSGGALSRLLLDDDLEVRRALIEGAARRPRPELVGWLVRQLRAPLLRPLAVDALEAMPTTAVVSVIDAVADRGVPVVDRHLLLRILGRFGGLRSVNALWEVLDSDEDVLMRAAAAETLLRMRAANPAHDLGRYQDDRFFERRLSELRLVLRALREAGAQDDVFSELLLDHARLEARIAAFGLGLRHGLGDIERVTTSLAAGTEAQRANALEVLDVALPRDVAARLSDLLVPVFVEPAPPGAGLGDATLRELRRSQPFLRAALRLRRDAPFAETSDPGETMTATQRQLNQLMPIVAFLKKASLFEGLDAHRLLNIARIIEERVFCAGEVVFSEGGKGDSCYLIHRGTILIQAGGRQVARLGAGECVGEMSLIDDQPRSATALAEGELSVYRLGQGPFNELLLTHPEIAVSLLKRMSARLREALAAAGASAA